MKALTTIDILHIAQGKLNDKFLGVYAANQLPDKIINGKFLIVNCCPIQLSGMHWLAISDVNYGKALEFFDSYGREPYFFEDIKLPESDTIFVNKKRLQSAVSEVCGYYALYYCFLKARQWKMCDIIADFSSTDFRANDMAVYNAVCELYDIKDYI